MYRAIVEISLVAILALGGRALGAQPQKQADAAAAEAGRNRLERVLERVRDRVELGRSLNEFADELSLFDNQLYGRLQNRETGRERMVVLKDQIRDANALLGQTRNRLESDVKNLGGPLVPEEKEDPLVLQQEVDRLQGELGAMNRELSALQMTGLPAGGNELPIGGLWPGDLTGLDEQALEELVEMMISGSLMPLAADILKKELSVPQKDKENAGEPK